VTLQLTDEQDRERDEIWEASVRRDHELKRREGLPHDYPGRAEDLQAMRRHHERLGEIPPERGFYAWWRRFVGGRA
jgi:hypothetical protein